MTAKEYLLQYRRLRAKERSVREAMQEAHELAGALKSPSLSGMPHSGVMRDLSDAIEKCDLIDRKYAAVLAEVLRTRERIEASIEMLGDDRQEAVLRMRYISGKSWQRIAQEMAYDERTIYRIHGAGLRSLQERGLCSL